MMNNGSSASRTEYSSVLIQSITSVEGMIRAYDTKAQIMLATVVLTISPIYDKFHISGSVANASKYLICLIIISFISVIIPRISKGVDNDRATGLYITPPSIQTPDQICALISKEDLTTVLAKELIAVNAVRRVKHVRLLIAVWLTIVFYLFVTFGELIMGH